MKFATVALALGVAIAFPSTYAAECDPAVMEAQAESSPEFAKVKSICKVTPGMKLDEDDLKSICANSECVEAYKTAYSSLPKCTVSGVDFGTAALSAIDTGCALIKSAPAESTKASSSTKASVAAATVVATAVAAAMAAL